MKKIFQQKALLKKGTHFHWKLKEMWELEMKWRNAKCGHLSRNSFNTQVLFAELEIFHRKWQSFDGNKSFWPNPNEMNQMQGVIVSTLNAVHLKASMTYTTVEYYGLTWKSGCRLIVCKQFSGCSKCRRFSTNICTLSLSQQLSGIEFGPFTTDCTWIIKRLVSVRLCKCANKYNFNPL